jgi:hypothetical protein
MRRGLGGWETGATRDVDDIKVLLHGNGQIKFQRHLSFSSRDPDIYITQATSSTRQDREQRYYKSVTPENACRSGELN